MANLRANKITTGTVDYQGSIYASGTSAYLLTTTTAPGTDDFTIECWINSDNASGTNQEGIFDINAQPDGSSGYQSSSTNRIRLTQGRDGTDGQNGGLEVKINDTAVGTGDGNDIIQEGTWHHIAVTRASGTVKIWVDGVEKASGSAAGNVTGTTFVTGYYDTNYTFQGYMSNFRYRKGTAHYTTTFTPPTGPLERTSDTELLFAQSANNAGDGYSSAIHGGTTDIMQVFGNVTANTSAPTLTTTSDVGVVFDGDIKINSQGYMYFPTGDTSQRSRGRCIISNGSPGSQSLYYLQMQSGGIVQNFGLLANNVQLSRACGSSTRMLVADGYIAPATTNVIEYITIATTGGGTDYGDLTVARRRALGMANTTRGVWVGGTGASPAASYYNEQDYNTIATTGNATDFGDASTLTSTGNGVSSSTRGVYSIAYNGSTSAYNNTLEYITFATTGSRTNFGDLSAAKGYHMCGCSSSDSTRGLFAGGYNPVQDTIDYITMASTGDATDFGNLSVARRSGMATGNSIDAIFVGGYLPGVSNTIDKVTIQTTGNAVDFGDLTVKLHEGACSSDSHGGLS